MAPDTRTPAPEPGHDLGRGAEPRRGPGTEWDAAAVRRLRTHLAETQGGLARRLGTRQQTVSEWETGASRPRGMSQRLLHLVAEENGFYRAGPPAVTPDGGPDDGGEAGSANSPREPGRPNDFPPRGRDAD